MGVLRFVLLVCITMMFAGCAGTSTRITPLPETSTSPNAEQSPSNLATDKPAAESTSELQTEQTTARAEPVPTQTGEGGRTLYELGPDRIWQLDSSTSNRLDTSALSLDPHNNLFTIDDKEPGLYLIKFSLPPEISLSGKAVLETTGLFSSADLAPLHDEPPTSYDLEGIAIDQSGNIYTCEEKRRAIYRFNLGEKRYERLEIDWTPVRRYFAYDPNASFEGVAVSPDNKLYVANERNSPRIFVVDLNTLKVVEHFYVNGTGFSLAGPHYSDLSWFDGHLYVLDRHQRVILQVNPVNHEVMAEFRFGKMETAPAVAYKTLFPTGTMEGLAVDNEYFWLLTDNNGKPRVNFREDIRPTLFRCKRPDIEGH